MHAFFARQQKRPAETLGMLPQATRIRSAGCSHGTAELTNEMSGVFPSDCFALPLAVGLPQELSADPAIALIPRVLVRVGVWCFGRRLQLQRIHVESEGNMACSDCSNLERSIEACNLVSKTSPLSVN